MQMILLTIASEIEELTNAVQKLHNKYLKLAEAN